MNENKEIISNSINSEQHVYDLSILIDIDKINHHDKEDLSNAKKNKYYEKNLNNKIAEKNKIENLDKA